MNASPSAPSHAFLSYVSEDDQRVDQLEDALTAAGIRVWRDKNDIAPGGDWKAAIRAAIKNGSLAFIACFSEHSDRRDRSYQYEELAEAVSEFRQRPPSRPWLFPVRFADVELPDYEIGPNRDLNSLHRSDLFGSRHSGNLIRLVQSISDLIGGPSTANPATPARDTSNNLVAEVRRLLRDPHGDLLLEELVDDTVAEASVSLNQLGETVLTTADALDVGVFLVQRALAIEAAMRSVLEVAVQVGMHGNEEHMASLGGLARTIASCLSERGGRTVVLSLNRYPTLLLLYAVSLGAVARKNWPAFAAVTSEAKTKVLNGTVPIVGYVSARSIFPDIEWAATALFEQLGSDASANEIVTRLATQRGGMRHTPVSDHLHDLLRPLFAKTIRDDQEYSEAFDRTEIMLDLVLLDAREHSDSFEFVYLGFGRYTWRNEYAKSPVSEPLAEYEADPKHWPPLEAGLFGGDLARAKAAWTSLEEVSKRVAQQQRFR